MIFSKGKNVLNGQLVGWSQTFTCQLFVLKHHNLLDKVMASSLADLIAKGESKESLQKKLFFPPVFFWNLATPPFLNKFHFIIFLFFQLE